MLHSCELLSNFGKRGCRTRPTRIILDHKSEFKAGWPWQFPGCFWVWGSCTPMLTKLVAKTLRAVEHTASKVALKTGLLRPVMKCDVDWPDFPVLNSLLSFD